MRVYGEHWLMKKMDAKKHREIWDSYFYPETTVYKNKLGLKKHDVLRTFEYEQVKIRTEELRLKPIIGNFDLNHLKKIHKYLYQDVYTWAGNLRLVNISKRDSVFVKYDQIKNYAQALHEQLKKDFFLKQSTKNQFIERLTIHYAEWNALHPFRDGNGRTIREFMRLLAEEAGYTLDTTKINENPQRWMEASAKSFNYEFEELQSILNEAIRPYAAVMFENLPFNEACLICPELNKIESLLEKDIKLIKDSVLDQSLQEDMLSSLKNKWVKKLDSGFLDHFGSNELSKEISFDNGNLSNS